MSFAFATKLKLGVTFGHDYKVVILTVHKHTNNRYEMLYNLISHLHPRLIRNKAIQPSKRSFNGDIYEFTQNYRSWLLFQENRG